METNNNSQFATQNNTQPITLQQPKRNGMGIAGFVLSMTGLILAWVPILGWLLMIPAFILSIIGCKENPRTMAVIGVIISGIILLIKLGMKATFWEGLMALATL